MLGEGGRGMQEAIKRIEEEIEELKCDLQEYREKGCVDLGTQTMHNIEGLQRAIEINQNRLEEYKLMLKLELGKLAFATKENNQYSITYHNGRIELLKEIIRECEGE